jgi:hypothetical protein
VVGNLGAIAILTFAIVNWATLFLTGINVIIMVFIVLVMSNINPAGVT